MTIIQIAIVIGILLLAIAIFAFALIKKPTIVKKNKNIQTTIGEKAEQDVEHIFSDEFREELRNRGRLYFEKIISDNAALLQQDLSLTTAQLNNYIKGEISRVLQEQFAKYDESIASARDLAIESIRKTQITVEQQRLALDKQMNEQVAAEKSRIVENFEKNMADIVEQYILSAISHDVDMVPQIDRIIKHLEENKQAIVEDIRSGA